MSLEPERSAAGPEWVFSLIGSRLTRVRALAYFTSDHIRTETLQFQLETDRSAAWTVLSGRDGESIELRPGKIDPSEAVVVANLGYSKIIDEASPQLARALDKQIETVALFQLLEDVLIGFRLVVTDGSHVEIFNAGDKLVLLVNQEHPLASSEGVNRSEHKG